MLELFVIVTVIVIVIIGDCSFEVLHVSGWFGGSVVWWFGRSVVRLMEDPFHSLTFVINEIGTLQQGGYHDSPF